jgi:hypothetical protein
VGVDHLSSIWAPVSRACGYIFKPKIKSPRVLSEGLTRGNLLLLAFISLVVPLLAVVLTNHTFSLYLPYLAGWRWVDVTIILTCPFGDGGCCGAWAPGYACIRE